MSAPWRRCGIGGCCVTEARPIEPGKIGVVTVTYNSGHVLQEFFDSLAAQIHRNFVLYVVDNASKDQTPELTQRRTDLPGVLIANAENLGVAEGNNQGIRAAIAGGCECVLLLNNDTVFPADFIAQLYAGLDRHRCDMTTGKMYYHDRPDVFWCAGGHFQPKLGYRARHDGQHQKDVGQYDQPRRVTYVPTCCLLVRRSVFDRIGLMDSRYFVYSDDVDFLYRCLKQGLSLWYVPEAKLWHKVSSLTGGDSSAFALQYMTRNRIYFLRKNMPHVLALYWYIWIQTRSFLAFLSGRNSYSKWNVRRNAAKEGWNMYRMQSRPS
jgi:GT2 family glycosyltransferase